LNGVDCCPSDLNRRPNDLGITNRPRFVESIGKALGILPASMVLA